MCARSGFGYRGTSERTLVPVQENIRVYPRSGFGTCRGTSAKTTLQGKPPFANPRIAAIHDFSEILALPQESFEAIF